MIDNLRVERNRYDVSSHVKSMYPLIYAVSIAYEQPSYYTALVPIPYK